MRKTFVALTLLAAVASAQMIYGQWYCKSMDWNLTLDENGSYLSSLPGYGTSTGSYFIEGYLMHFQDAVTAAVASYTFQFGGDVLQLTDQMGTPYLFARIGSAAMDIGDDVVIEDASYASPVLARKDGYNLREEHIKAGIDILEFTVGESISEAEANELLDAWLSDFDQDPVEMFDAVDGLKSTRDQLFSIKDPWEVAMLRASLVGTFHKEALLTPPTDWHKFLKIMFDHVEVVAFDDKNQLAFTDRDLDAYLDYAAFLVMLNTGQSIGWTAAQRDSVGKEIADAFSSMTLDEKKLMCGMEVISLYLDYAWENADANGRQAIAGQMVSSPEPDIDYSTVSTDYGSTGQGMSDETYRLLNDVMLEEHAASMNVLSSISDYDSPYYYEVVDQEY